MVKIARLIFWIGICLLVGSIGGLVTSRLISTWYQNLNKPFFTPPSWVFMPVWTILYILMGTSAFLVGEKGYKKKRVRQALGIFLIQLLFNLFWSIIFFGLQSPVLALLEIFVLWGMILLTMTNFKKISKLAFYLLVPYILWVTFASILNLFVVILN